MRGAVHGPSFQPLSFQLLFGAGLRVPCTSGEWTASLPMQLCSLPASATAPALEPLHHTHLPPLPIPTHTPSHPQAIIEIVADLSLKANANARDRILGGFVSPSCPDYLYTLDDAEGGDSLAVTALVGRPVVGERPRVGGAAQQPAL